MQVTRTGLWAVLGWLKWLGGILYRPAAAVWTPDATVEAVFQGRKFLRAGMPCFPTKDYLCPMPTRTSGECSRCTGADAVDVAVRGDHGMQRRRRRRKRARMGGL